MLDKYILLFDNALRSICVPPARVAARSNPADTHPSIVLSHNEQRLVQGLMRVNHSGEVCAQALYQGQSLTARSKNIMQKMQQAALEEIDHLAWCEARLRDLQSTPSKLNIIWYTMSFILGACTGRCGDKISLGFVAETECQVGEHLAKHIAMLPAQDQQSCAILQQMQADEAIHANMAIQSGGVNLPIFIKKSMRLIARLMTWTSFYI